MTLTEFLLARIAEDEAVVTAERQRRDAWAKATVGGSISISEYEAGPGNPLYIQRECEAKRRIVEQAIPSGWTDEGEPLGGGYIESWWDALRFLAAVYSDHPDYQQEWKS